MKRTFLKTAIIAACAVLMFGLLSACGTTNLAGTWYLEDTDESFYNFEEDGNITGYDLEYDWLLYGDWTENDSSYDIGGILGDYITFELTNKDTLYSGEYDITLKRGTEKDIPAITSDELATNTWMADDGIFELEFYYTDDWELYDYDVGDYIDQGTYIIEDGNLTMETTDGAQYHPTIAENRHELTLYDDLVFFLED